MTTETKPTFWQRINPFRRQRSIDYYGGERNDLLSETLSTPEARRLFRSNSDIVAIYGAVFAAIRRRARAVAKPRIVLVRDQGGEEVEVDEHPALDALKRVNESLTQRQGFGLIEQHKLTHGKAYWVKRRDGLGTPVEFEIWPPDQVRPIPDPDKPWVPAFFERRLSIGKVERVAREDIVWFRHMVDPGNPLNGLSPIGAVRSEIDTGIEAQRFNLKYFDNALMIGRLFSAEDAGPGEVERIEQELERKFKGTDRVARAQVLGGGLKALETKPPHKDMEFVVQQQWGVEEVARVFEFAPELLGLGNRTYENAPEANRDFWTMIVDQVDDTLAEFNEFYLWPDFGEELRFIARYDEIESLQRDRKQGAEVDEIRLKGAVTFVNEIRERDGMEPVEWGDVPLMPLGTVPLGTIPTVTTPQQLQEAVGAGEEPLTASLTVNGKRVYIEEPRSRSVDSSEGAIERGWRQRLNKEAEALATHFAVAEARLAVAGISRHAHALEPGDVDSYDWDWWQKYGDEVIREFETLYGGVLADAGFVESPLLGATDLAASFARRRGSELLQLSGRLNVVEFTKRWVNSLVAQTIEQGESLQALTKNLRSGFGFSKSRAEMIARTETANAQTDGSIKSYQSQGTEGKEWLTAGDERVDGGDPSGPCIDAEGQGPIAVGSPFNNGFMGPAAHPRCRCTILPVRRLPRAAQKKVVRKTVVRKTVERDEAGRIVAVIEEETDGA
jgi:HK97 family phage portal protein